jgi:hypothetical protein
MKAQTFTAGCKLLLAAGVVCSLAAPSASAELPSQDAYAGQALVLGSPHPHHNNAHSRARNGPGSSGGSGSSSSGGNAGGGGGGGGGGSSGGAGSGGASARGSGGTGSSSGGRSSGAAAGSGAAASVTHSSSAPHASSSPSRSSAAPTRTPTGTGRSADATGGSPLETTQPAAGSVPFSGLDVLMLVVGLAVLLGTAALLRGARRSA